MVRVLAKTAATAMTASSGRPTANRRCVRPSGEFRNALLERTFRDMHADENFRHARVLLIASAILNSLS